MQATCVGEGGAFADWQSRLQLGRGGAAHGGDAGQRRDAGAMLQGDGRGAGGRRGEEQGGGRTGGRGRAVGPTQPLCRRVPVAKGLAWQHS